MPFAPVTREELVPIRVGMILIPFKSSSRKLTCPHTRGDDPVEAKKMSEGGHLSPYAWG